MRDIQRVSSDVNNAIRDVQRATGDAGNDLRDTSETLRNAGESAREVSEELGILQTAIKNLKPIMLSIKDKASPILKKAKGLLDKLMNTKIMLYIKDKASPILKKVKGLLKTVANKTWSTILMAKDKISPTLNKIKGLLKTVTKKAWKAIVKIDDKISPKIRKITGILKSVISKTYKAVVTVKDKASSVLSSIKGKLLALAGGITIGVKAVLDTTEATREYNRNQAVISGAASQGGYNDKDLKAMRRTMYGDTGDDMMATNAVSNLTGMGLSVKEMQKTLDSATAVWTKYGDSIPIEGLTESINETAQVSKVTGNLADALNWAGVSEDDFNAKLEGTKTVQERAKLINDTLMQSYGKSKQIYDENTKAMREYNMSQDAVAQKQAELGMTMAPINTMLNNAKVALMNGLIPAIQQIAPKLLEVGAKVGEAFNSFSKSQTAGNMLQIFQTVSTTVWNAVKSAIDAVSPTIQNIFNWIGDHSKEIQSAIQALGDIWSTVCDAIKVAIEAVWPVISQIISFIIDHMDTIKTVIQTLGNVWQTVWGIIGPVLQAAWTIIQPILSLVVKAIEIICSVINGLVGVIKNVVNTIKNIINTIKGVAISAWNAIKNGISIAIETIKSTVIMKWIEIKTNIQLTLTFIKGIVISAWNAIKNGISIVLETIKSTVSEKWNAIKETVSIVIETIRAVISEKWNAIKETVSIVLETIRATMSEKWNAIKETVSGVVETIKSNVINAFENVKSTVTNAIDSIRGVWNDLKSSIENNPIVMTVKKVTESLSGAKDGNHAAGLQRVPYNNYLANLHSGEAVLPRREADKWRKGKGNSPQINITMNGTTIRENADIEKIASALVRKLNQQRIITG